MWRTVVIPALVGAFIVAGTVYGEWRSPSFWQLPWDARSAKIVVGLLGLFAPLLAAVNAIRARREKLNSDAYAALLAVLAKVASAAQVPIESIGIHAYLVRSRFPWVCKQKLERIARVRLSSHPPPSTIEWTKGKGFVGVCWAVDRWADFAFDVAYAGHTQCASEADWLAVPEPQRYGLTFPEWERSRVYRLVRVYPIHAALSRGRHRFVGCVSLDTIEDTSVQPLLSDEVRNYLAQAAATLAVAMTKGG